MGNQGNNMSISKEAVKYVVLLNNTKESSIEIPNLESVQQQPPWRHSKTVFVEINDTIVDAQYGFDGHPACMQSGYEKCIIFSEGILPKDTYNADIKIDTETGQKYLRTPEIFLKIWENDPRIPTTALPEYLGDPVDAGWTGNCS